MLLRAYDFVTVDVFTDKRFGGNPLAVFTDARGLSDDEMQKLATEMNLSETTFVLPPEDPSHTARVRIFNTTAEMPFAGHPMVGTGYVLSSLGHGRDDRLSFEVPAGVVDVTIARDGSGAIAQATIDAPRPLSIGQEIAVETIAACAGIEPGDVVIDAHRPLVASVGNPFAIAQISDAALKRATPVVDAFRKAASSAPELGTRFPLHLYCRDGAAIRARMFAPLAGTFEDPATGSANAPLAALLLSLTDLAAEDYIIHQGVEMGRPSLLRLRATRGADGIRASVGGACVPVLKGQAEV